MEMALQWIIVVLFLLFYASARTHSDKNYLIDRMSESSIIDLEYAQSW